MIQHKGYENLEKVESPGGVSDLYQYHIKKLSKDYNGREGVAVKSITVDFAIRIQRHTKDPEEFITFSAEGFSILDYHQYPFGKFPVELNNPIFSGECDSNIIESCSGCAGNADIYIKIECIDNSLIEIRIDKAHLGLSYKNRFSSGVVGIRIGTSPKNIKVTRNGKLEEYQGEEYPYDNYWTKMSNTPNLSEDFIRENIYCLGPYTLLKTQKLSREMIEFIISAYENYKGPSVTPYISTEPSNLDRKNIRKDLVNLERIYQRKGIYLRKISN